MAGMTSRDNELRRQAEAVCARRTRELEDARTALARQAEDAELGRALRELTKQVTRLRHTDIKGGKFGFSPGEVASMVQAEVDEVRAEQPGSVSARAEVGDVFTGCVHLAEAYAAPLLTTISRAAGKLKRRLDLVDMGATWPDAKVAEANERDIEAAETCDGDHAQGECPASRCIRRDTTIAPEES